jgi:CheY-like chemotaxis protein
MLRPVYSILIADRNRHVRNLLARELEGEGYRVATARNGKEVLDLVESAGDFDLLVVDEDLPDLGGMPVVGDLRDARRDLPVIVHAHNIEEIRERVREPQTVPVRKSENMDGLKAAIRSALDRLHPDGAGGRAGLEGLDRPDR